MAFLGRDIDRSGSKGIASRGDSDEIDPEEVAGRSDGLAWVVRPWAKPRWVAGVAATLVVAFFLALLFPGAFTFDSIIMVEQADDTVVDTNWHPPVAIEVWAFLLVFVRSAVGLWVAQTVGLGLAFYSVARSLTSKVALALLVVVVVGFPPFLQVVAPLWKDSQLAIVYLAALGLSSRPATTWPKRVALGLVALAIVALRFNAFLLAILPLWRLVESLPEAYWRRSVFRWVGSRPVLLALGLTFGITAATSYTGSLLVERSLAPQNPTQVWDMVGILVEGGDVEFSARMQRQPPCSEQEIIATYDPGSVGPLTYGDDTCFAIIWPDDYEVHSLRAEENNQVSTGAWIATIVDNPGPYARHRMAATTSLVGAEDRPMRGSSIGLQATEARVSTVDATRQQVGTLKYMRSVSRNLSFMYRPFVWMVTLVLGAGVLWFRNADRQWIALMVIPLAATLGIMMLLSPVATMRYSFPFLVAAIFLLVQAVDHLLVRK